MSLILKVFRNLSNLRDWRSIYGLLNRCNNSQKLIRVVLCRLVPREKFLCYESKKEVVLSKEEKKDNIAVRFKYRFITNEVTVETFE
jgi:hypothetical protein